MRSRTSSDVNCSIELLDCALQLQPPLSSSRPLRVLLRPNPILRCPSAASPATLLICYHPYTSRVNYNLATILR